MSVETDKGRIGSLAFGDILTAEEPVWVWDIEARRILWANPAGRVFWGAETLESLRQRRFDARNKTLRRLAERAGTGTDREWTDTFTLPGRRERAPVTCSMQTMEVAGGRPGLIVRALDMAPVRAAQETPVAPRAAAENTAALKHIAARLKRQPAPPRVRAPAGPSDTTSPPADTEPAQKPRRTEPQHLLLRELTHELRNPLTVISGFAERIRDSDPVRAADKIKAYTETILEGVAFAMAILEDFAARIREDAAPSAAPEPADVKAAVTGCVRLVVPLAHQAGVKLSKSVGRRLPRLRMEERALKQILLNILLNAIRHQKTGGRITLAARMQRNRRLLLAVSDDGIGMTKKEIKTALSGKSPPDGGAPGGGSGLGLPLVKRLVESAGGAIAIESARHKGTTIAITFPAASLVAQSRPGREARRGASSPVMV